MTKDSIRDIVFCAQERTEGSLSSAIKLLIQNYNALSPVEVSQIPYTIQEQVDALVKYTDEPHIDHIDVVFRSSDFNCFGREMVENIKKGNHYSDKIYAVLGFGLEIGELI